MLVLPVLAGTGIGCVTPAPLVRLTPRSSNVFWIAGRAAVQKEDTGVRVAVAFEHQNGQALGVRVEVQNLTEGTLDLKPQDFSYVTCKGTSVDSCGWAKPVIDPETILMSLDVNQSREEADATNNRTFKGTLLLLSAVGDVATVASGRSRGTTGLQSMAIANAISLDELQHTSTTASIAAQRQLWSNDALRRNTLPPGAGAAGYVYVPIETNVKYLWFTVRAGGRRFPFCFEQVVTEIEPPQGATASYQNR